MQTVKPTSQTPSTNSGKHMKDAPDSGGYIEEGNLTYDGTHVQQSHLKAIFLTWAYDLRRPPRTHGSVREGYSRLAWQPCRPTPESAIIRVQYYIIS